MPFRTFHSRPLLRGTNVFSTNLLGVAALRSISSNTQDVDIRPGIPGSDSPAYIYQENIVISTIYENGENKGLVKIEFANIFQGNFGTAYSSPSGFVTRQTGYESTNGISFQSDDGKAYYLRSSGAVQPGQTYSLANDGSAGSFTETTVPCYASGTAIKTTVGHIKVEDLGIDNFVIAASGEERPVRWIGKRTLSCNHHPYPEAVWPVRVLAGAFGDGLPRRDLWLSPDHAVCIRVLDEVLIPIKHLINDATVAQVETDEVAYWHVELDSHDILLAEGLPAESFLDTGVRAGFENGAEHMTLHPDFSPLSMNDFCRPLVQEGPIVDAVRLRLLARASELGWALTGEDDLHAVVDGAAVYPEWTGTVACFAIPAGVTEIRLHSRSFVPERVRVGAGDGRRLSVPVRGLSVVDGAGVVRSLPIGSETLSQGFSFVQGGAERPWRWTTGEAVVPSILWSGTEGAFSLIVELAPEEGALQAWQAPGMEMSQEASDANPEAAAA